MTYCQRRFEEGVRIASILTGALDTTNRERQVIGPPPGISTFIGSGVQPQSIMDFDSLNPDWQNVSGEPNEIALAGHNLIILSPIPDDVYEIGMDILSNMPVPIEDDDFLQIGREHFESCLDYAVYLAMFKVGGLEFQSTLPLADNFMQQAMLHNELLRAEAKNYTIMRDYASKEDIDRPRFSKDKELQET